MSKEEMIKDFLRLFVVESDHPGAEVALTLIVETLERRAELKGALCVGLTPRGEILPDGTVVRVSNV